jgi:putative phosphoesterase
MYIRVKILFLYNISSDIIQSKIKGSKMKILAFSDSHHDISGLQYPIQSESPDIVIHLGDNVDDALRAQKMFPDIIFHVVKGNCDFNSIDSEKTLELTNYNFFITHGHKYSVKSTFKRVVAKGIDQKADIILFGHTHKAYIQKQNGVWIINPGSSSSLQTRDLTPSYSKIEISEEDLRCSIITR